MIWLTKSSGGDYFLRSKEGKIEILNHARYNAGPCDFFNTVAGDQDIINYDLKFPSTKHLEDSLYKLQKRVLTLQMIVLFLFVCEGILSYL